MHVGMVCLDGVKMSKSLGNLVFVGDLLKIATGEEIRLGILSHHYRSTWDWSDAVLALAKERIARWRASGPGVGAYEEVIAALDYDLDTPTAIDAIERSVAAGNGVRDTVRLLGIDLEVS
jgi:L-cysteine:1D-myo-inositol 2-amino-2-deoxy-alpha-D-glucopyranoside ligase